MKKIILAALVFMSAFVIAACAQSAPTPTAAPAAPTTAVAAPTKAAAAPAAAVQPTAAAPQPTAVPKVDYPAKGKPVSLIVAYPAGSPSDISSRLVSDPMEKELGTPIQVINKGDAGGQAAATDIALAKPDGYTFGAVVLTTLVGSYIDPERKAVYNRNSYQPLASHTGEPVFLFVRADSPYKTFKDLIDAAKAKPETIPIAITGQLAPPHLAMLELEKTSGAKFAFVMFDGSPQGITAVLGGHVVGKVGALSELATLPKDQIRALVLFDQQRNPFAPDLQTAEELGYKGTYMISLRTFMLPAGVPKDVLGVMSDAFKRTTQGAEFAKRMEAAKLPVRYIGSDDLAKVWDTYETTARELMQLAKKK